MTAVLLLFASLLVIPGLMALALLMEWLERTFAQRLVVDDIVGLVRREDDADLVERRIVQAAAVLVGQRGAERD
jgi:hypothetical protein